jgi:hypothetical protein
MKITPEVELAIKKAVEEERERSDRSYAIKLVEKIVFGLLTLFGAGTVSYIVSQMFK